jgi:S-adenosylmethionine hydrolase
MKTRNVMALAIILASFGSVSANVNSTIAKEDPSSQNITIKQIGNLKFRVILAENDAALASIQIIDENGNEIYSENINSTKLNTKLYDLSNLTDGTYTFVLKSGKKVEKQKVNISTQINRSALIAMN